MFCMECGKKVKEGVKFCTSCGTPVDSTDESDEYDGKGFSDYATEAISKSLNQLAGGTGSVTLRFGDFFKNVFKRHTPEEAEQLFICGTAATTPSIDEISSEWPKPWLYSRVFLMMLLATLIFYLTTYFFDSYIGAGNFLFIGALLAPLSVMIFFFETNAYRNVSLMDVFKMFLIGGAVVSFVSILLESFVLPEVASVNSSGYVRNIPIAIIEEAVQVGIILIFVVRTKQCNYILSGMLVGAAVGAGFSTFETCGYGLMYLMGSSGAAFDNAVNTIVWRDVLAIGSHVAWGAVEGGALMLVVRTAPTRRFNLLSIKFWGFVLLTMGCHYVWNINIPIFEIIREALGLDFMWIFLTIFVWIAISVLLNRGLAQVNGEIEESADDKASIPFLGHLQSFKESVFPGQNPNGSTVEQNAAVAAQGPATAQGPAAAQSPATAGWVMNAGSPSQPLGVAASQQAPATAYVVQAPDPATSQVPVGGFAQPTVQQMPVVIQGQTADMPQSQVPVGGQAQVMIGGQPHVIVGMQAQVAEMAQPQVILDTQSQASGAMIPEDPSSGLGDMEGGAEAKVATNAGWDPSAGAAMPRDPESPEG